MTKMKAEMSMEMHSRFIRCIRKAVQDECQAILREGRQFSALDSVSALCYLAREVTEKHFAMNGMPDEKVTELLQMFVSFQIQTGTEWCEDIEQYVESLPQPPGGNGKGGA